MVTRKAFVRPIFRRLPHLQRRSKRRCEKSRRASLRPLCEDDPRGALRAASSRDENWCKKCRLHKIDAIRSNAACGLPLSHRQR